MAYAALISLSQTLKHILGSTDQFPLFHGEQQFRSLQKKLSFLLSFLEDSSPKNRKTTTHLEGRIRDATYEAQDIIESHMSKQILVKSACRGVISCFWEIIYVLHRCANSMLFSKTETFEESLQKVVEKLHSISEEVKKMKDADDIEGPQPSITHPPSEFSSPVKTQTEDQQPMNLLPASVSTTMNVILGLDDDLLQIKQLLLIGQSSDPLKIIPIVGMGGIGKSTLARNIYNDATIVPHFDIRSWTTIPETYHLRGLLIGLVNSITGRLQELNDMTTEDLKQKLYQTLKGNRYLAVMDGMWDTKSWDELKRLFPNDNNGSRIILTTRQTNLAAHITNYSVPIHHMNFLSLECSWDLLRQKVFGKESCPPEFEKIGKVIAEKCKGLPLALVVVGGLLYKAERTLSYWFYVAENVISIVNRDYEDFMEILSWSYNHLPHHLRACFLYMGVFPKAYVIHVSYLIRLWVVEGFLKPVESKTLEETAKEYLEDLIDRNLIMVQGRNCLGEIKTCNIHDLMRDLCVRKAQEENLIHVADHEVGIPSDLKNCRRICFHQQKHITYDFEDDDEQKHFEFADMHYSTVRSFLYFGESLSSIPLPFQRLTVLDTCGITFIDEFPVEIVELVNLRYVALIYNGEAEVPASISKLQNLETLIIFRRLFNSSLLSLPKEIWKIKRLRHLLFDLAMLPLPPSGSVYWNLETISGVYNFAPINESTTFPILKTLRVFYQDNFLCEASSLHPKFTPLYQLESLKCVFISLLDSLPAASLDFSFPSKLKKLTLGYYKVSWERMSVIGSLSNLEVLKLRSCAFEGPTWRTNEGEFSHLKYLLVESEDLAFWETENEHFPSLECLVVKCPNLECIPPEIGAILTLQQIILIGCQPSVETSANSIKEEQHDIGNDGFQLNIYPDFDKYIASTGHSSFRKMYVSHAEFPGFSAWQRGLEAVTDLFDEEAQKFMGDAFTSLRDAYASFTNTINNEMKSVNQLMMEGPSIQLKSKAMGYENFINLEGLQSVFQASSELWTSMEPLLEHMELEESSEAGV